MEETKTEPETPIVSQESAPEQNDIKSPEQPQAAEDPKEVNWRKFREQREADRKKLAEAQERERKKAEEAEVLRQALEKALSSAQTQSAPAYESDEDEIKKRVNEAFLEREKEYERKRLEQEQREAPLRLKQQCPDFETVCSQENVDYLEYNHPEVFTALKSMPDGFDKWTNIYRAMKRYIPEMTEIKKEAKKAEANLAKPLPPGKAVSKVVTSAPTFDLSEERRKANWERMQKELKTL
jgi:hypothetical protein